MVRERERAVMSKRILVTGGAGFVGSHLCERLVNQGHHVTCLDNFLTGRYENIKRLCEGPPGTFELFRWDVTEPWDREVEIDQIYNLACPASPVSYQADPVRTMKTSVLGALNVLELAKRCKARVLQASTSEVYGDPKIHPQPEKYWGNVNPVGIRACYDEGKRAAETLFMDYRRQYKVDTCIARIFNTYGPRMQPDDGRIVSTFIRQALKGSYLTVFGNGLQTRSFCYVDDLVDGLIKLMNATSLFSPMNLGNDSEYTVLELADRVIKLTGSKSEITTRPLPSDDPQRRRPDLERAYLSLGYTPKVPLMAGLEKTIKWFQGTVVQPLPDPKPFPVAIQGL
jgi:UDP-glucuronate decarboxylase